MAPFLLSTGCSAFEIDWANAVDDLQVVILSEIEHEAIGHRLNVIEPAVDENGFLAVVIAGADVGGVFHLAFGAEGGHDATQAVCPVAGAKFPAVLGQAKDDEGRGFRCCHVSTLQKRWLSVGVTTWPVPASNISLSRLVGPAPDAPVGALALECGFSLATAAHFSRSAAAVAELP